MVLKVFKELILLLKGDIFCVLLLRTLQMVDDR